METNVDIDVQEVNEVQEVKRMTEKIGICLKNYLVVNQNVEKDAKKTNNQTQRKKKKKKKRPAKTLNNNIFLRI